MKEQSTSSVMGRKLRLALAFVVVLAVMAPVAVIAAGGTFVDDDTSIFEGDIEWMAANAITSGCGPDTYCPESNVTRGQMAAFMKRLATKKVVDAATAVTADSAASADHATTADNAASADHATTADSAATAVNADNADTLNGLSSAKFARGNPTLGTPVIFTGADVAVTSGTDTVIVAATILDLPDYCGIGFTSHEVLLMAGGTVEWTAGQGEGRMGLTADTTVLSFNGSTRVFSLEDDADTDIQYASIESHYVTSLANGTHTLRLMADGFNGTLEYEVRNANLTVIEMGWSCA